MVRLGMFTWAYLGCSVMLGLLFIGFCRFGILDQVPGMHTSEDIEICLCVVF